MRALFLLPFIFNGYLYQQQVPLFHESTHEISNEQTLVVNISLPKPEYRIGDHLRLRVEIQNVGAVPLYIGNQIPTHDWLYHIEFLVKDGQGNLSSEVHFLHPYMPDAVPKEDNSVALTQGWMVLQPNYFFGVTLDIPSEFFDSLKKPGEYTIQGIYSCEGMEAQVKYNYLANDKEFLASLPYRSWKGTIKSNIEKIRVLSAAAE